MVFVDDFVFGFYKDTSALQASLVLMFMSFLRVPISWNKLELGTTITWTWLEDWHNNWHCVHYTRENTENCEISEKLFQTWQILAQRCGKTHWYNSLGHWYVSTYQMDVEYSLYNPLQNRYSVGTPQQVSNPICTTTFTWGRLPLSFPRTTFCPSRGQYSETGHFAVFQIYSCRIQKCMFWLLVCLDHLSELQIKSGSDFPRWSQGYYSHVRVLWAIYTISFPSRQIGDSHYKQGQTLSQINLPLD